MKGRCGWWLLLSFLNVVVVRSFAQEARIGPVVSFPTTTDTDKTTKTKRMKKKGKRKEVEEEEEEDEEDDTLVCTHYLPTRVSLWSMLESQVA